MIPATFDYEVAESVEHAVSLLGEREDAKLIAGGHSLLPAMKLRIARPSLLIDIAGLDELDYVREDGDRIAIGAVTRHKDVRDAPLLQEHCPIVSFTAGQDVGGLEVQDPGRLFRPPLEVHEPRRGVHDVGEGGAIPPGARLAVPRDRAVHEIRPHGGRRLVVESHARHDTG